MSDFRNIIQSCKEFKKEAIELLGIDQSFHEFEEHHGLFEAVIITASSDEFESVKSIVDSIKPVIFNKNDSTIYYQGTIQSKKKAIKVLIPFPYSMGLEAASSLTTKVISNFRPRYIFMVGICAGNKNLCKIGDVIIAEKSLNYHSIVEIERKDESKDKKFMHNLCSINGHLKNQLELYTKSKAIQSIKESYPHKSKIESPLKAHIGLLVTGSSLLRSSAIMKEINDVYIGVKGLDMETYGLYYSATQVFKDYAPNFLSVKSVNDYGDNTEHKLETNERRNYSLYTSSNTLKRFINEYLE
jgi:nucleoside phosphorylase